MELMNLPWASGLRVLVLLMPLLGGKALCAQGVKDDKHSQMALADVREVRIVEENGKVLATNPPGIAVKAGETLNGDAVASSIHTLYGTGDYADLKAVTTPDGDGVRLDFVVRENFFFNQVVIEGLKPPPSEASASGAMQLSLGQTYYEGDVEEAVSRLKDTLRDDGLYQAKVTVEKSGAPGDTSTGRDSACGTRTPGSPVQGGS